MPAEGSVAPRERVNIVYRAATGDGQEEKELPLKLLMLGDYTGRPEPIPLEERKPIGVNRDNFDDVLAGHGIEMLLQVANRLDDQGGELPVRLRVAGLKDFAPESIARQIPELRQLLELREALSALKGPLGNLPAFRTAIQDLLADDAARAAMLAELGRG